MASMTIKVSGVPIDLIANLVESSNACVSIFDFNIISSPGANISLNAIKLSTELAYDKIEINHNGNWQKITTLPYAFTLNSAGKAQARVTVGNSDMALEPQYDAEGNQLPSEMVYVCNESEVTITDTTNSKTESTKLVRCYEEPRCPVEEEKPSLTIDNSTNVFIYFDSSGSMDSTLAPLTEMRDTLLKDALLPYYNNDAVLYDSKVKVVSEPSERTLHMLDILGTTPASGKIISLVFQDEAEPVYTAASGWTINTARTTQYNTDMTALRTRLNSYVAGHYRGVIFQVNTGPEDLFANFKSLSKAVQYGSGVYAGTSGLSDRVEFNYKYDVIAASTAQYYKDLVVAALEELGFTI